MAVALQGNNPGGIIDGSFARSQPGYAGANGIYAAFRTMADGIRAQITLLRNYIRRGLDTPNEIANRWAPSGVHGNNSSAYAQNIARQMGIGVNDRITESNLSAFQNAQARAENNHYGSVNMGQVGVGGNVLNGYAGGPRNGESQIDYLNRIRNGHDTMTPEQRQAEQDFIDSYSLTPNLDNGLRSVDTFFTNLLNGETIGRIIIVIVGVLFVIIAVWAFLKSDTNINITKGLTSG